MKQITTLALCTLAFLFFSCGDSGNTTETTPVVEEEPVPDLPKRSLTLEKKGFLSPESVISDGTHYYISNVGKKQKTVDGYRLVPTRDDGDGYISKVDSSGKVIRKKFMTKLNAPKGMEILGESLYVTDINKIVAFNLQTGKKEKEMAFAEELGTKFLNDLEKKSDTELFVSSTDLSKIYVVDVTGDMSYTELEVKPAIASPNGLWYDGTDLYVVSYKDSTGKAGKISFAADGNTYKELGDSFSGSLDGLAIVRGKICYSDWNTGAIRIYNPRTQKGSYLRLEYALEGPADFYYDESRNEFWIPAMLEEKVYVTFADF